MGIPQLTFIDSRSNGMCRVFFKLRPDLQNKRDNCGITNYCGDFSSIQHSLSQHVSRPSPFSRGQTDSLTAARHLKPFPLARHLYDLAY